MITRRQMLRASLQYGALSFLPKLVRAQGTSGPREFNVRDFGAVGDGVALDTGAVQRALDEAGVAGRGTRVVVPGGRRFLVGSLNLPAGIELHLADDTELIASADPAHYTGPALLHALDAPGLRITGTGRINGRAREFMTHFDTEREIWHPKPFRPRLAVLTGCTDLEVRDVTFFEAPSWTLHLLGCRGVLVDRVQIRNVLDVPNCDGIDPDHCRDVEIRNCDIACGDDAIVVKATREGLAYGGSEKIRVKDCTIATQDSGLKIGTETVADIRDVRFERCTMISCCRGCTIQLRDEGHVSNIEFRDIKFAARYHSAPWWGRGEGISFTALPRTPETKLGTISDVRVVNITGRAENSVRVSGSAGSRIRDVRFDRMDLTLARWTKYRGGEWDNRPTTAMPGIEPHDTPAIHVRHADRITFKECSVRWGPKPPDYFTHALEAEEVTQLTRPGFRGDAAHPGRDDAVAIR